jgi:hypothetical protein
MKIQYFVASMAVAAVLVTPTVYSGPGGGTQVTHFLSRSANVNIRYYNPNPNYYYVLVGEAYDDMNGVAQGSVESEFNDYSALDFSYIRCEGPTYANAVSVNRNDGSSTVNATLDPASSDCVSFNVFEKITVTVYGQIDGNYSRSDNGNSKEKYGGATYKSNYKSDTWSQTFSADNGFYSGTFTGDASISQKNDRTRVK